MKKKVRKDFALGYVVKENPSVWLNVALLLIVLGIISVIVGVVFFDPDVTRYVLTGGGLALAAIGGVIFLVQGTTVRAGEIYCFPEKIIVQEKGGEKQVFSIAELTGLKVLVKSYEGQTSAQISAGFSVIPKMEEGNHNFIQFVHEGMNYEYRFQIENGAMYNKFVTFTKQLS